jgi:uncharacterized protein HemY
MDTSNLHLRDENFGDFHDAWKNELTTAERNELKANLAKHLHDLNTEWSAEQIAQMVEQTYPEPVATE